MEAVCGWLLAASCLGFVGTAVGLGALLACRRLAYERDCARDDAELACDEATFYRDLANAALAKLNPADPKGGP